MKIYWTMKSIPELAHLPKKIRKRNYYEARRRARSHYEHWIGAFVFFVVLIVLFTLFEYFFPGEDTFVRYGVRAAITIPASILVLEQFVVYTMRKYYRDILMQNEQA